MKWWPGECKAGDIIRIPLGAIHHYGVYIADDEVIQFGEPPIRSLARDEKQIRVGVTDIGSFSCGQIIEIGEPEKGDGFRRVKREKAIATARARVGEDGYSLLHNNCEHFAYDCVFGVKYCEQEARTREKWLTRPVLDVYAAPLSAFGEDGKQLTEYALKRSLNISPEDLRNKRNAAGYTRLAVCRERGMIAVAVSRKPVALALEKADAPCPVSSEQLLCAGETAATDRLALYLKKRCLYDLEKKTLFSRFIPAKCDTQSSPVLALTLTEANPLLLVCAGEQLAHAHLRVFRDNNWQLIPIEGSAF